MYLLFVVKATVKTYPPFFAVDGFHPSLVIAKTHVTACLMLFDPYTVPTSYLTLLQVSSAGWQRISDSVC